MVETISKGEFLFVPVSADILILGWGGGLFRTLVIETVLSFYETGLYDVTFYYLYLKNNYFEKINIFLAKAEIIFTIVHINVTNMIVGYTFH